MKRSAVLALAACALALASLCTTASARELSEDTYKPKCEKVQEYEYKKDDYKAYDCTKGHYDSYYTCCPKPKPVAPPPKCYKVEPETYYKGKEYSDYDCKKVTYGYGYDQKSYYDCCAKPVKPPCKKVEKEAYESDYKHKYSGYECKLHDYHYTSYYVCCPKPKPEPKCYEVETEKYKESEYTDYDCKEVKYGYGYDQKSYYDCCAKPVEPPCKKVAEEDYKPDYYEHKYDYECKLHDYHYTSYYVCCPKPTPAPTYAPTKAPTYPKPQPPKCRKDYKKICCTVFDKEARKQYKKDGYSCDSYGRGYNKQYVCCKKLPKPTAPKPVCYYKKFGYKSRKCCYDHEKKYKKDKKYKCFYNSYKGHKGDYCYKKD